jgi:hypothetical protein
MPDWKAIVHERLAALRLNGAQEAEVVEELAQDLEERYEELLGRGVPKDEAIRLAQQVLDQADLLGKELADARSFAP